MPEEKKYTDRLRHKASGEIYHIYDSEAVHQLKTINGESLVGEGDIHVAAEETFSGNYNDLANKPFVVAVDSENEKAITLKNPTSEEELYPKTTVEQVIGLGAIIPPYPTDFNDGEKFILSATKVNGQIVLAWKRASSGSSGEIIDEFDNSFVIDIDDEDNILVIE